MSSVYITVTWAGLTESEKGELVQRCKTIGQELADNYTDFDIVTVVLNSNLVCEAMSEAAVNRAVDDLIRRSGYMTDVRARLIHPEDKIAKSEDEK